MSCLCITGNSLDWSVLNISQDPLYRCRHKKPPQVLLLLSQVAPDPGLGAPRDPKDPAAAGWPVLSPRPPGGGTPLLPSLNSPNLTEPKPAPPNPFTQP